MRCVAAITLSSDAHECAATEQTNCSFNSTMLELGVHLTDKACHCQVQLLALDDLLRAC